MATATVNGLKAKSDAAWANINKQLQGMEPFLDKSDAPGEWTTRQVICHLLFEPGWDPVALLKSFSTSNLPVVEITSVSDTSGSRQTASLKQLLDSLDAQRKAIWGYLEGLSDADLKRKARIPLFKELMPELMWRAYQEVKLSECDAFEANNEEFERKAHFDVF